MNTAIRETRTAADAPAPLDQLRARRTAQRGVVRREVAERGPRAGGPGVDARVYRRGPVRTPPCGTPAARTRCAAPRRRRSASPPSLSPP